MIDFHGEMEKLAVDKEFQKGVGEYNSASELSYIRMENSVLRAFDSIPGIEVSASDGKRAPRIFELCLTLHERPPLR